MFHRLLVFFSGLNLMLFILLITSITYAFVSANDIPIIGKQVAMPFHYFILDDVLRFSSDVRCLLVLPRFLHYLIHSVAIPASAG